MIKDSICPPLVITINIPYIVPIFIELLTKCIFIVETQYFCKNYERVKDLSFY
jgi:hypothetical protein